MERERENGRGRTGERGRECVREKKGGKRGRNKGKMSRGGGGG